MASASFFGPSDRIRTCGLLLPKQARYQLRYTQLLSCFIRLGVFSQTKHGLISIVYFEKDCKYSRPVIR